MLHEETMPRSRHVAGPRAIAARVAAPTLIVIGYLDLVRGGTLVAPLALVIGYVVLVPIVLFAD
jgi:hypothetical protein